MIQDIYPSKLDNSFHLYDIKDDDNLLVFDNEGRVLVSITDGRIHFTTAKDVNATKTVYLFSVDDKRYFLAAEVCDHSKQGFSYHSVRELRDTCADKEMFAAFTAYHLWKWYSDNRYCGKCASFLEFDQNERALVCKKCGNIIYPRINPAVIVGVIKDECLLVTRYRRGYGHNALVAGFTEIGETLEETVAREVLEETGVHVKNIRYYKSQPWGMAQDILVGFFCEADGDGTIRMDENELKYAEWVRRGEIEMQPNNLSLTNEMMRVFNSDIEITRAGL